MRKPTLLSEKNAIPRILLRTGGSLCGTLLARFWVEKEGPGSIPALEIKEAKQGATQYRCQEVHSKRRSGMSRGPRALRAADSRQANGLGQIASASNLTLGIFNQDHSVVVEHRH
jgi:hypothetical protein